MKTMITTLAAIAMIALSGCKTQPTIESMTTLGKVSGYTAAYVLNNQAKVDDVTRNVIIEVMTEAEKYIPETNSTYQATWMPMITNFVNKGVADGKLPQEAANRVLKDLAYVTGLLDAYVEKKGIYGKKELTDAFIHAFCRSFLTNFKPANMMSSPAKYEELDEFTVKYLSTRIK